jgi:glycosyltransferase involved in cell wall biosynthesis
MQWRGEGGVDLESRGVDVVGLPRPKHLRADYFSFLKLRRIILEREIDLVHSHSTDALVDAAMCRRLIPNLKHVHTFHYGNYPQYDRRHLLLERFFCSVPDRLVAVGLEQRKTILETYPIAESKLCTIRNGVEPPAEAVDPAFSKKYSASGKIVIGSICNVIEQKGLSYLLDVAKVLSAESDRYLFVIAGDGPLKASLLQRRDELRLQNVVEFIGRVPAAAGRLLPVFDIFFQPSLWEAMSMSILEAMIASKPVVATDVGEAPHMIRHGETGLLIEPKDVEGMAAALRALANDRARREQMGSAGKILVQRCFTTSTMVNQYESLYRSLLET